MVALEVLFRHALSLPPDHFTAHVGDWPRAGEMQRRGPHRAGDVFERVLRGPLGEVLSTVDTRRTRRA
ncbi:MAG TPA: hypothetical protein VMK12_28950 [Anaeromyxobacteraceae bacterium]|nr:hypothetical protein [Anaeromyxobacteraceae bacterium]